MDLATLIMASVDIVCCICAYVVGDIHHFTFVYYVFALCQLAPWVLFCAEQIKCKDKLLNSALFCVIIIYVLTFIGTEVLRYPEVLRYLDDFPNLYYLNLVFLAIAYIYFFVVAIVRNANIIRKQ